MKKENAQKLALKSKVFKIPISEYEGDMDTIYSKEKKNEILDLFTNYNNLHSEEEFKEIRSVLHESCRKGDIELIKIYLSERIENDSKDMIFKIDKANKTASLFNVNCKIEEIIIPRTVKHESIEYLVTSITDSMRFIKIIKFDENSAVKKFYNGTFLYSDIKEIYFPASLKELKEGWCRGAGKLNKINISPSNNKFIFKENKYLLGKNDENEEEFDIFLFASRDIENISIPTNIKIISSYSFENCENLTEIEIPQNSNLQIIEPYAFSETKIKEIFIPSNVTKICEFAFYYCEKLNQVEISANSNLQIIESNAFSQTHISQFIIPSNVSKICEFAFFNCESLYQVEIPQNSNLQIIESNAFYYSDFQKFVIPSNVTKICESTFYKCKNLKQIDIPPNSNLQIIESSAFSYTNIQEIYFPASLKELKEGWCRGAGKLNKINISPSNNKFIFKENKYLLGKNDDNEDEFDILLFVSRGIGNISIPTNIKIISSYSFENCKYLNKIEIPPNSKLQIIEPYAFSESNVLTIFIPSNVSKICEFAFYKCRNLTKVEIPKNSNLQIIESNAFSYTCIQEIFIPSNVTKICESTFYKCENLKQIDIPPNSDLQIIESSAFSYTNIQEIYFPASLKELKEGWCHGAGKLNKINISPSNNKFIFKENKYLLGKNDDNEEEFDILLFASRDIENISIPTNIKIISSYSFENCKYLKKIEIPKNSKLQIIESYAFSESNILTIFIPSNVTKICEFSFYKCRNLTKIEIPKNSNLQIIESNAFSYTNVQEIYFPASLKELKEGWCRGAGKLNKINISPSNNKFIFKENKYLLGKNDDNEEEFDILLFASRNIDNISIPTNIKIISSYSFENCDYLKKIEIPKNSKLQIIELNAFSQNVFKSIFIHSKLSEICGYTYYNYKNLITIEIPANDNESDTSIEKELSVVPHINIPFNCSSILSFSLCNYKMNIITKDYKAIINNESEKNDFEEYKIKDHNFHVHYPIS